MPLRRCQKDGKKGWSWGHAQCHTGTDAKKKALKQGQAIELEKMRNNQPSEFDKASLPSATMIDNAKKGLELRKIYSKGGENLVVLTLAKSIAEGEFISDEAKEKLRKEYNKRNRYATAKEDTLGYINFMLIGGEATADFLND